MKSRASVAAFAASRSGSRSRSGDATVIDPETGLVVLAHAFGGSPPYINAGVTASALGDALRSGDGTIGDQLRAGAIEANRLLLAASLPGSLQQGQAATFDAVHISGDELTVAHMGLGRVYLVRDGAAIALTREHNMTAECATEDERERYAQWTEIVTRALGLSRDCPPPDVETFRLAACDLVVVITRDVSRQLTPEQVAAVLSASETPAMAAERLVDEAQARDDSNDVTAVVAALA